MTIPDSRRGGCRLRGSHYQSSQAAAGGNLQGEDMLFFFFFLLFASIKIFRPFEGRRYYNKGSGEEMKSRGAAKKTQHVGRAASLLRLGGAQLF